MRDWQAETQSRVSFIKSCVTDAGARGIVFGNSGGKDCALVGILCRKACENVVGLIMPCASKRNYGADTDDAAALARQFDIETIIADLTPARDSLLKGLESAGELSPLAISNINPRLRMTTLYTFAQSRGMLVAGTGNRSEIYMGYFTKWGDGAYDFNPISDLTVREVFDFLRYLGAPESVIDKAPSAGLFDGQTDEGDMGVSYEAIDRYLLEGEATPADLEIMERYHRRSGHKRERARVYSPDISGT